MNAKRKVDSCFMNNKLLQQRKMGTLLAQTKWACFVYGEWSRRQPFAGFVFCAFRPTANPFPLAHSNDFRETSSELDALAIYTFR
ncbi:hypothetical protein L596_001650 [Steinernema carpocapsae]|uniref:Uncharacterized protein n=1 Tax=Steinernema carpocapsae TaxID=34508 RepID=A0A4U8UPH7_STECR|nr:hypothetical protein L596_001650 [Steinernema carpocapsae]